jgi:tRNA pseudouridine55 synthase
MFGLDKPLGLTSLQALEALRAADPSLRDRRLGHAGRLDPMAEGLLTVLVDDETRDAPTLRTQDKTYEIDVALGVATDSFDSFGLVTELVPDVALDDDAFARACRRWEGVVAQRYPPFSQARVDGRSLLAWGAAGVAMERPVATRTLTAITVLGRRAGPGEAIVAEAVRRVGLVRGELRQEAIAARWRARESELAGRSVTVVSLRVACSAGTYMRSLAHDLGAAVGAPSIAWRIRRTRAGALRVEDARRLP